MRGATQCAQRLKALFGSLRSKLGKLSPPPAGDPVTQLILGVLTRDATEPKAREALDRIRGMVVDYNELRVIPPIELAEMVGDYPHARLKCEDISRALNRVFAMNHTISLDHLADLPDKEVRAYLEQIDGLEAYTRARVRLLGLQQHAIPLDEAMWAYARRERIVDQRCPLTEAQAFLERRVAKENALEFVVLLRRRAWDDVGVMVRRGEVRRIQSVPPDRTARNMLRLLGSPPDEESLDDEPATPDALAEAVAPKASRRPQSPAHKTKTEKKAKPRAHAKAQAASSAARRAPASKTASAPKKKTQTRPKKKARSPTKKKPAPAARPRPKPKPKARTRRSVRTTAARRRAKAKSA